MNNTISNRDEGNPNKNNVANGQLKRVKRMDIKLFQLKETYLLDLVRNELMVWDIVLLTCSTRYLLRPKVYKCKKFT